MGAYGPLGRDHFEMLKWAVENGCPYKALKYPCDESVTRAAVKRNDEDMLRWAVKKEFTLIRVSWLATQGDLDKLRWLDHGCQWDSRVTLIAAKHGHFDLIKWAVDQGCLWHPEVTRAIASQLQEDALKWVVEHGCPWHPEVCEAAAQEDGLEIMQWAIQNGAGWTERVCELAAKAGEVAMIQWATENGHPVRRTSSLKWGSRMATCRWCNGPSIKAANGMINSSYWRLSGRQQVC